MRVTGFIALVALAAVASGTVYFEDNFDTNPFEGRWVKSEWKEDMGAWSWTAGEWFTDGNRDKGIQTDTDMKNHAISAKMDSVASNTDKDLIVQFSVKNEKKEYSFCGGGYIKLLPAGFDQSKFGGDSPYAIMFGPDLCGYDVSRIHLIFTDKSGKNLLKTDEIKLDYDDKNEFTHLFTLIVSPDHTYKVLFDGKEKASGSIAEGWEFPNKTIDDASDKKPKDWVDDKEIDDPADKKPEGYDDIPKMIADPKSVQPEEWDEEMDGEWEPAMIDNPDFKGEWHAKKIANPDYKGEWKPAQVENKDFYEDIATYDNCEYVGFELWTVNNGSIFDNVLVTDDAEYAKAKGKELWQPKSEGEKAAKEAWEEEKKLKEAIPLFPAFVSASVFVRGSACVHSLQRD